MKGGKSGRKRRGAPAGRAAERRGGKAGPDGRPKGVAPPKGSAKKPHFGGTSTTHRD